jgi:hypothetical protein
MYDIQQSVKESESFCFEACIRYNGVVAGNEGKGDVAAIGSLCTMSMMSQHYGALYVPLGPRCLVSARARLVAGT